jgi:hypothetical protein
MKIKLVLIAVLALTGCSWMNSKVEKNPATQRENLCAELKRDIIFSSTTTQNIGSSIPAQKASLMHLYDRNKCTDFEKK